MFFPGGLSVVVLLALSVPSAPPQDALALLNQVGQRYCATKSYRIEAISEQTSSNELSRDAKLVEKFPDLPGMPGDKSADFLGKAAPELQLQSADGKATELSSFRGKPVFIDFWATWCGPCVFLLKDLKELHAQTEPKGLVWIGIDSDEKSETSVRKKAWRGRTITIRMARWARNSKETRFRSAS